MQNKTLIELLQKAKVEHVQCMVSAEELTEDGYIQRNNISIDFSECVFGKWLQMDGKEIMSLPGMTVLKDIEIKHFDLHAVYTNILSIYTPATNKKFITKILPFQIKVSPEQEAKAKDQFLILHKIFDELRTMFLRVERCLAAL